MSLYRFIPVGLKSDRTTGQGLTKYRKGPQRTITNTANDRWGQIGSAKNRKGPQGSQTKDYKGPLGTARVCKKLHRILKVVVTLVNVTLICRPIL